jgi:hypothetical protein
VKLSLDGREYQAKAYSLFDLSIGEARTIKRNTGMSISEWRLGLMTLHREDPDVLAGIVFVLRHRAGEQVDWAEMENISTQTLIAGLKLEDGDLDPPLEKPATEEPPVKGPVEEPTTPAELAVKPVSKKPRSNGKTPAKRPTKPKAASTS